MNDGGAIQKSMLFYGMVVLMDRMELGFLNRVLAPGCALPFVVQLCGPAWNRSLWDIDWVCLKGMSGF